MKMPTKSGNLNNYIFKILEKKTYKRMLKQYQKNKKNKNGLPITL